MGLSGRGFLVKEGRPTTYTSSKRRPLQCEISIIKHAGSHKRSNEHLSLPPDQLLHVTTRTKYNTSDMLRLMIDPNSESSKTHVSRRAIQGNCRNHIMFCIGVTEWDILFLGFRHDASLMNMCGLPYQECIERWVTKNLLIMFSVSRLSRPTLKWALLGHW